MAGFTHLRVHSHYTLLGATAPIADLVQTAASQGMDALALTDTNVLYGAVAFTRACDAAGIQPILGMVVSVAQPDEIAGGWEGAGEVVLLATGRAGWRSLCALSSSIQGRADRAEAVQRGVDWETLRDHREGLLCLVGGRRSWLGRSLRQGDAAGAARYVARLGGVFGEQAILTIEAHTPADGPVADATVALGKRFGLPVAAVQPVFCREPSERSRLRLLAAMAHNCPLAQVTAAMLPDEGDEAAVLHWQTPEDMAARFAAYPDALAYVGEVAARCEPALPDGRPIWPALALEDDSPDASPDTALTKLAEEGLRRRYGSPEPRHSERLTAELALIAQHGFAPLFLLVADITRFARRRMIPYNTRGSVANSLVAYCVGITTVDPVAHDLLFERFLNPERANLPDIDLDFCSRRRDEVLHYVRKRYGAEQVALVATIATLRPKSAVRETAKAYGLDEETITALVGQVRDEWHPDPRRRQRDTREEILARLQDAQQASVMAAALDLVGTPHHLSIHPGGVVVAPGRMTDYAPVQWTPKGFWVTQFAHEDVEALGLPKIDLLGIRALTVLADAVELVRARHGPGFDLEAIALDDAATGDLLAAGDTVGVFQCESTGAQRTLRQLRARSVRDLAVANAFFKPGPATGGMAHAFVRRYRGEEPVRYLHPALEPILAQTQGVLLFQEQVLRVAREIAGLSWAEADRLRRGMSRFRADEMAALQARFVAGCTRAAPDGPGMSEEQAQTLWTQAAAFAGYGFNQGHATAYADVSYRSAYLKAHYPAEFLCARLADWGGFHHQAVYIAEARRLGIAVRPPHVNHSGQQFTLAWEGEGEDARPVLWMGLGQVRDLRRATIAALLAARRAAPFRDVDDLIRRVQPAAKECRHLIQCGALDGLGESRRAMLAEVEDGQRGRSALQMSFDFAVCEVEAEGLAERLQWEQRVLGMPISSHGAALEAMPSPCTLAAARQTPGRGVTLHGVRLPGWTGGKGWFLAVGDDYAVAVLDPAVANPRPWRPLVARGAWQQDQWGNGWVQVTGWSPLK